MSATTARAPGSSTPLTGDAALVRAIGLWPATMLLVGNVIGSAIFLTTGTMLAELPSVPLVMLAWLAGGLLACAGGLTLAELGTMFPRSGGMYVFLEEAYGPVMGYLYGWSLLLIMLPGSLAAVAVGFAEYFSHFVPALGMANVLVQVPLPFGTWSISAGQVVAALSILAAVAMNLTNVRRASGIAAIVTAVKVAALVAIPVVAFMSARRGPDLTPVVPDVPSPLASFGVVMIAVMWAYEGWYYLAFAAGEVENPSRTLPRAFIAGTLIIMATYLLVNVGYFVALPAEALRGEVRVAERVGLALVGPIGASLVALLVCVSTFGNNIVGALAGSRTGFAMASQGMFFRFAARVHPVDRSPHGALIGLGLFSALLTLLGNYEQLFTYVTFGAVAFNTLGVAAIFVLRRLRPDAPRPYRTWGYPIVPALFVLASLGLVASTFLQRPIESLLGVLLIAAGLPAYYYWRSQAAASERS
jgi:APA family basic amino acid/polyamine antiporter